MTELDALMKLDAERTPGAWTVYAYTDVAGDDGRKSLIALTSRRRGRAISEANAAFIAAAPRMAALLREQAAEIERLRARGALCESCGRLMDDGRSPGYPRKCVDCTKEAYRQVAKDLFTPGLNPRKTNCPTCGKRVKDAGLKDHMRAVHGQTP